MNEMHSGRALKPAIPVTVVTGFLGAGKTTLINRLAQDPALAGTGFIINEFGEIGIDHLLVGTGDEGVVELSSGCLCCTVREDLVRTLLDLKSQREAGELAFDRIMIVASLIALVSQALGQETDLLVIADRWNLDPRDLGEFADAQVHGCCPF